MPPKAPGWKTLTRVATNPFRRSISVTSRENSGGESGGSRSGSRPASVRAPSIDIPRAESPDAGDPPTAQAPNPLPISLQDSGAVDLTSPTEANAPDIPFNSDPPIQPAPAVNQEAGDVASGAQETTGVNANQEVDQAAQEVTPAIVSQSAKSKPVPPTDATQEAQDVSAPPEAASFEPSNANQEAVAAPELPAAATSATQEAVDVAGGEDHERAPVVVPVPVPVPVMVDHVNVGALQPAVAQAILPVALSADHTVKDVRDETTETVHPGNKVDPYASFAEEAVAFGGAGAMYSSESERAKAGLDPFTDSQGAGIIPTPSPNKDAQFPRPYTIPGVHPVASVSQDQVQVDDDDNTGLLVPPNVNEPMNGYQEPLTASYVSHTPLSHSLEIAEWTVYTLPNGAKYFFHSKARIVTDVDITHPPTLRQVIKHLDDSTRSIKESPHKDHKHVTIAEGRLVDDTTPLPTASTQGRDWPSHGHGGRKAGGGGGSGGSSGLRYGYGATSSGFAYWKADAHTHEQGRMMGLEIWAMAAKKSSEGQSHGYGHANGYGHGHAKSSTDHGSGLTILWVDHISKTVVAEPPWSKLGAGRVADGANDEEEAVEPHLRYWEYVQAHPAHIGLPPSSAEEAVEALTWCYTELLMRQGLEDAHHYPKTPFTLRESHDLLELIKNLDAQAAGPLQTNVIAKVHIRLAQHKQHLLHQDGPVEHNEIAPQQAPFRNISVKAFIALFCFGIPWLYVPKPVDGSCPRVTADGYHEIQDHREDHGYSHLSQTGLLADSPIFGASLALVASILLTASVVFLALPGVEDGARLSSLICLFLSASSLGASVITLRRRAFNKGRHRSEPVVPKHPFIQGLPLVFLLWALIALITSAFLYVYRVSSHPGQGSDGRILNNILRLVTVAVGSGLVLVLLLSCMVNRR